LFRSFIESFLVVSSIKNSKVSLMPPTLLPGGAAQHPLLDQMLPRAAGDLNMRLTSADLWVHIVYWIRTGGTHARFL
jgi:hypothetical protein